QHGPGRGRRLCPTPHRTRPPPSRQPRRPPRIVAARRPIVPGSEERVGDLRGRFPRCHLATDHQTGCAPGFPTTLPAPTRPGSDPPPGSGFGRASCSLTTTSAPKTAFAGRVSRPDPAGAPVWAHFLTSDVENCAQIVVGRIPPGRILPGRIVVGRIL